MQSLFTSAENHITMQLCVHATLCPCTSMCSIYLLGGHGCINLGCQRICGQTTLATASGKGLRTNDEHLSLSDVSTNTADATKRFLTYQPFIRNFISFCIFFYMVNLNALAYLAFSKEPKSQNCIIYIILLYCMVIKST